jgi:hypothetical protein
MNHSQKNKIKNMRKFSMLINMQSTTLLVSISKYNFKLHNYYHTKGSPTHYAHKKLNAQTITLINSTL